jgi:hypothetical protein
MGARCLKTNPLLRTKLAKVAEYALASVRFAILSRASGADPEVLSAFAVVVAGDGDNITTHTWSRANDDARRRSIAALRDLADRMEARL